MSETSVFLSGEPDVQIINGIVYFTSDGVSLCMPVSRWRANIEIGKRLLAEWDAEQRGKIIPFQGRRLAPPGVH